MTDYDAIVIGAGQPGPGVAAALAGEGKRVLLIERERVGGTCLNHGCKPTKALRASAMVAHQARRAAHYGVHTGEVTVDFGAAMARVHSMIDDMRAPVIDFLERTDGLDLIYGEAKLRTRPDGKHEVTSGGESYRAPAVYLNLGARASVPPLPGIDSVPYLTEVELLQLSELPNHLIVVGGGYIGLEFAQMFRRFGAAVTLVAGGGIAPREDEDVSAIITDTLTDEGVEIVSATTSRVGPHAKGVEVTLDDGSTIAGSHLLMATGRRSNLDLIGDEHGLEVDDHQFVQINGRFETSVPGVWALGDINGHGAFTHTAYQDGQILQDASRTVDGRITTYAMFTDPVLGRVGMTEREAKSSGRRVLKAEVPMSGVSRAIMEGETRGLIRVLVDADDEQFLGATFLGLGGDDLCQFVGLAMQAQIPYPTVRDALPVHPTMAEYLPSILNSLQPLG
ncbi:MAG TPA: mercuric reductase [Propionibacteriaceae bacterium]|nr:mercuric reductase [Propionibacteriaceae bacterium]